jgi:hypothetical protein
MTSASRAEGRQFDPGQVYLGLMECHEALLGNLSVKPPTKYDRTCPNYRILTSSRTLDVYVHAALCVCVCVPRRA